MRKVVLFAFLLFSFLLPQSKIFASENFSTAYNATYNVGSDSNTHVVLNGTLKNLTDKYYAASYSIQLGFTDIKNLSVSDEDGKINPKVSKNDSGSIITLTFNREVVGLNNKLNFIISFDTSEIAQNLNNVWDINIPGISSESDFSSFNATLNYPSLLGKPTYIKPYVPNAYKDLGRLIFTKSDLGGSGISIAFGEFQVYDYDLKYHLQNTNLFPISTEIALPPSTNYQDVIIDDIYPKPLNVRIDQDGNWLANYHVSSSQKLDILVKGKIKVFLNPRKENLNSEEKKLYLKSNQYWDVNNPKIQSLANNLKTPYAIYQYVIKNLKYDFSRVESNSPRLGSIASLDKPDSAVCLEFTDLFIALARAAGIPAREIDGYAYTTNSSQRPLSLIKDILHAWPEYYDFEKNTWIMVDPTWGNTTGGIDYFNVLDFDHITFVVKGLNSNYPVPAGGYKLSKTNQSKDVAIKIGKEFGPAESKTEIKINIPSEIIAGIPIIGTINVKNKGSALALPSEIELTTNYIIPKSQTIISKSIPPFGSYVEEISFDKTSPLTNMEDTIKITIGNNLVSKKIRVVPFFLNKWFLFGGIIFVSIFIVISLTAYISRRIYIQRQIEKDPLRREGIKFKK